MLRKIFLYGVLFILGMGVGIYLNDNDGILTGVCEIIKGFSMFMLCVVLSFVGDWFLNGKSFFFLYLRIGEKSLSDKITEYTIYTIKRYNNVKSFSTWTMLNDVEKAIKNSSYSHAVIIQWSNINARNWFSLSDLINIIMKGNHQERNRKVEEYINNVIIKTCGGKI